MHGLARAIDVAAQDERKKGLWVTEEDVWEVQQLSLAGKWEAGVEVAATCESWLRVFSFLYSFC